MYTPSRACSMRARSVGWASVWRANRLRGKTHRVQDPNEQSNELFSELCNEQSNSVALQRTGACTSSYARFPCMHVQACARAGRLSRGY